MKIDLSPFIKFQQSFKMEDWRSDEPKNSFFWKKPTKNVVELNPDGTPVERVRGPIENFPPMAIWTPMSRITEQWATGVQLTPCADFELDFHKCSSRVGAVLAKEKCKEFHEDLMECVYHTKSVSSVYHLVAPPMCLYHRPTLKKVCFPLHYHEKVCRGRDFFMNH